VTDRGLGWLLVSAQFALLGVLFLAPTGTAGPLPDAARVQRAMFALGEASFDPATRGVGRT
jgi:hypothetical protein